MTDNMFAVYAPPKAKIIDDDKPFELCADRRYVVTAEETEWVKRCYRCNAETDSHVSKKLSYLTWKMRFITGGLLAVLILSTIFLRDILPEDWYVGVLFSSGAVVALVAVIFLRKIKLELPFCTNCKRLKRYLNLAMALFMVLFFALPSLGSSLPPSSIYPLLSIVSFGVLVCLALVNRILFPRLMIARHSDNRYGDNLHGVNLYWLKGTGSPFRDSLPDFL